MTRSGDFLTGVVEGYYGRAWSFDDRLAYAGYLAAAGLNTCLYCPKADPYLRRRWQRHWPAAEWQQLHALAAAYRQQGVFWGVGLSPFALYRQYGRRQRDQLQRKIGRLAELEAPLLAILFDDMPGDIDALARRQAEIVADVVTWLPTVRLLVCPTYYSFDPVLETHFGRMPPDYWGSLGRDLPAGVDIFWTGNRVCSDAITRADIERICAELGRPVVLWDNYPVNDGAVRSNFIYLNKLSHRDALPGSLARGHLCNPMNQSLLSLPALSGLAQLYRSGGGDAWLRECLGAATWRQLKADASTLATVGMTGLSATGRRRMAERYRALPGPAARELVGWLEGEYRFDPACLTD